MATFQITSPDGQKYEITAPDDATEAQVLDYAKQNFDKRRTPMEMRKPETFSESMKATLAENPMAAKLAAFANFPRQLYEGTKQAFGKPDPFALAATKEIEKEHPVIAGAGTLATAGLTGAIPGANTLAGLTLGGGVMGAAMPTEPGQSRTQNALLSMLSSYGVGKVMKTAEPYLGKIVQAGKDKAASLASMASVRNSTISEAQKAGYVIPPSVVGSGHFEKFLESVGGKAAIGQEAAIRNQAVTNRIARTEAGLSADQPISEGTLAAARDRMAQPYKEIAALSPRAASALEQLKEVRLDAKDFWKKYGMQGDPVARREAVKLDSKAGMLERVIEKEAARLGKPGLLEDLRKSRTAIAKNHNVEKALNVGSGDVDARIIGRLLDRGTPMTGGLRTIGKFAEAFKPFAREISAVGQPEVSKLTPYSALLLGSIGLGASEYTSHHPYGAALGAFPLLSPAARSIALSRLMQRVPEYSPGIAARMANVGISTPGLPMATLPLSRLAAGSGLPLAVSPPGLVQQ